MKAIETAASGEASPIGFGKYRLLRKLGAGGMAQIDLAAIDGPDGFTKTCVIKRILPQLASLHDFSEMFITEAKIAALLNHPNVVQVFEFGKIDDQYYLAMEHVDGPSLDALIVRAAKAKAALGPSMAIHLGIPLCDALHYVHTMSLSTGQPLKLVHRDVTPGNVLISHSAEVKLTDFGVVKCATNFKSTQAGVVKGKFAYMSPEQATGKVLDHRSDLFSLGVVLFEVATGRRLWKRGSPLDMLSAVSKAQIPRPTELIPDFPQAIERILLKALARDPDERYQSAADMMADLDAFRATARLSSGRRELSSLMNTYFPDPNRSNVYRFPTVTSLPGGVPTVSERKEILAPEGESVPSVSLDAEFTRRAKRKRFWALAGIGAMVTVSAGAAGTLLLRRWAENVTAAPQVTVSANPAKESEPEPTEQPEDGNVRLARAHRAAGLAGLERGDYELAIRELTQALTLGGKAMTDVPELIRIAKDLQPHNRLGQSKHHEEAPQKPEPKRMTATKQSVPKMPTRTTSKRAAAFIRSEKERAPEPRPGLLLVTSSPSGLLVEVDGKGADLTPCRVHVTAGAHRVALVRGSQRLYERQLEVNEDGVQAIDVDVSSQLTANEPAKRDREVKSEHTLESSAAHESPVPPARAPEPAKVIAPASPSPAAAELSRASERRAAIENSGATGEVSVVASGVYGDVWINGQPYGTPPLLAKQVPAGEVVVEIRVAGAVRRSKTVTVVAGTRTAVKIR